MVIVTSYGHKVHSVVIWSIGFTDKSRTVCYDEQEEKQAISKFYNGDFGKMYDGCTVWDIHGNIKRIIKKEGERYREIYTIYGNGRTGCTRETAVCQTREKSCDV